MKKTLTVLVAVAVMLTVTVAGVGAFPAGEWVSGVTVANLESVDTHVWLRFYNDAGTEVLSFDGGTIGGNGAKTWYLPTQVPGLPDPFVGSAVVEADGRIAATVNTQLPSGTNPMRVGTSIGVGTPGPVMYATQLLKDYGGWNSYCAVQNTGSTAFTVTARFYNAAGTEVATETESIPGFSSHIFDQSVDAQLTSGVYSAKFEGDATHPLAVVCNFYNSGADANTAQFHSYNGLAEGAQTLHIPRLVKDYYDYQSGLKIQNVGTEALAVTVTYNFGGTTYNQTSPSIGPGQSWGPYLGDEAQVPPLVGVSGSGSGVVAVNSPNANKAIIATINEDNRVNPAGRGVTYEAALPTDGTDTLVFPQVVSEYYGYSSGIQVSKIGAGTLSCTASYSASGPVAAFSDNFSLTDAVPSWSQFAPGASGMIAGISNDDYNGAVTVSCPGGSIVGISNLSFRFDRDNRYPNLLGDSFTTARGVNK